MKYLIVPALLLSSVSFAKTYDFTERFGIGGGGGYTFPVHGNDFDDFARDEVMWEGHARYNFTPEDGLQLGYNHFEFDNTDINARVIDLTYIYRVNEGDKFTPILGLGAGVADMDNISPYHDGMKFASKARLGFEYALTDDLVASIHGDYQFIGKMPFNSDDEDDDDEAFPGREIFAIVPQIGLTYYFGPDKEIDDKKDPAPAAATVAPFAATVDDDNDGVINEKDKCPGTEAGKPVNAYGCMPEEKVNMRLQVLFPSGGYTLGEESNPHLNKLADFMKEHENTKLEIQGHTDSQGNPAKNMKLSEMRANAVRAYLVEKARIDPSRIKAQGFGDSVPIGDNATAAGRTENRRVIGIITQ